MATNAEMTVYRDQVINLAEQTQGLLAQACTQEYIVTGNEAVFLVTGSDGNGATTRGSNGDIVYKSLTNSQNTITLKQYHGSYSMDDFDVFASQGNMRNQLQRASLTDINYTQDQLILAALAASSTAITGTVTLNANLPIQKVLAQLGNAKFPMDGKITAVVSPAALAYLEFIESFASSDYVDMKTLPKVDFSWDDKQKVKFWAGIKWISHPNVAGVGTDAEKMYFFHESAVGFAANTGGMKAISTYDEIQDRSVARCSCFMGAKTLQVGGVLEMTHDGSALS